MQVVNLLYTPDKSLTIMTAVLDVQVGHSPTALEEPIRASLAIVESAQCCRAACPFSHNM